MRSRYDSSEAVEDVRCTCSRQPILARLGSQDGVPFLHVKSVRSKRTIVDVKVTGGVVTIVCRECLRSHRINMESAMAMSRNLPTD